MKWEATYGTCLLYTSDTITVGECSGVTLEEAKKYARSDEKELNMVFQFEHMDVDLSLIHI